MDQVKIKEEPIDDVGKEEIPIEKEESNVNPTRSGSKRKAAAPKHVSELEKGGKEPHAKKSKKEAESEKYKSFIRDNKKYLKKEGKKTEDLFKEYKGLLEDSEVLISYCLKYFYFLDKYVVKCTRMLDYDNLHVECFEAADKLEYLQKLPANLSLPEDELNLLVKKFGYTTWKVPQKDKKWIQRAIDNSEDGTFEMRLVSIEQSKFKDKNGKNVVCVNPVLRYE